MMGREIDPEERRLKNLLVQIGRLVDQAGLTDDKLALVDTPLPVAVSVEQAAALLGVAPSTVDERIRSGELRHFRMGRRKLILLDTLHAFARKLEAQAAGDEGLDGPYRVCDKMESGWFQPFEHQVDHGYVNPGFAGFRKYLIVLAQPSAPSQPR